MGYYGLSGNLALAFGPSLGLLLADLLSFSKLFAICAALGIASLLFAASITYRKIKQPQVREHNKWDIYEKSALIPSILLFFLTVTFGGIASFLPLYTAQKGISGIQLYFLLYALALMVTRTFAGQLYDRKGHKAVFIPGAALILLAMLLLAWLPNKWILFAAAVLYGFGFGTVQPALQAWSVERAPKHRKGMANATFFSFFDLGVGVGAMVFGQIGHWLGYACIYLTAALSVSMSILFYLFVLKKEKKAVYGWH
jgi:predicted MFS family arabinose efflux permease